MTRACLVEVEFMLDDPRVIDRIDDGLDLVPVILSSMYVRDIICIYLFARS